MRLTLHDKDSLLDPLDLGHIKRRVPHVLEVVNRPRGVGCLDACEEPEQT